ncbi:MAG: isoprenylcysteine carboxylmethyltransferase family protein [Pseudomonadota bacterium]|nr:isoprenylcysteine carboxylmethyltransferase family protein [Pseudomonadota bacterium]
MPWDRLLLPVLVAAFVFLALVWPMLRTWRRHGVFALVVHQTRDPLGRFVGRGFGAGVAGIAAWATVYAALGPAPLGVWDAPMVLRSGGLLAALVGLAVVLAAQAQMGASWRIGIDSEPTALVARGLYRWVRHPIYTGLLAMLVGVAALTPSAWTLMGGGWIASLIALQARLEDTHLFQQHGASWLAWASRTGRLVPGVGTVAAAAVAP